MFKGMSFNCSPKRKFPLIFVLVMCALVLTRAEPPCPDELAISPCFCYTVDGNQTKLVMDCSEVLTEEQLQNAFLADFPTRDYLQFYMHQNLQITRLGNMFQGTTFRIVYLWQVVVDVITDDCFIASADNLESLVIDGSMLNTSSFPFNTIGNYSKLTLLDIASSKLDSFPDLSSDSLTDVWMQNNKIVGLLPASAFRNTPKLTELHIYYNYITEIESGAFSSLPLLRTLSMFGNLVSVLRAGTFVVSSNVNFGISSNSIIAVEPGAFSRVNNDVRMSITLSSNFMTEIVEYVWADVLLYNQTYLSLSDNPLVCGCDIAWILSNETFLGQLDFSTMCEDGRLLYDLDPAEYSHC